MGYSKLEDEAKQPFIADDDVEEADPEDPKKDDGKKGFSISKKQKIFLAIFVILTVAIVAILGVMVQRKKEWFYVDRNIRDKLADKQDDRKFTLEEVLGGKYSFSSYSLTWVSDDKYLHTEGGVYLYNMGTAGTEDFLSGPDYVASSPSSLLLSPDHKWLMFSNNSQQLYRHSSYADYYIKDLRPDSERKDKNRQRIIKIAKPDDDENEQIRYCGWANNKSAFVFVYKCNIYYVPSADEKAMRYFKLTDDGLPTKVFNGVPDWVYEEEIIASTHAIEFSNDGKFMSYVKFNATEVPYYKFPKYGDASNQYTTIEKIAYPKAGYPNPTIKVTIINLLEVLKYQENQNYESKRVHPKAPSKISKGDYYYAVMKWTTGNELLIQWMNRAQNETVCTVYDSAKSVGRTVEGHDTPNGWIDDDYVKPKFSKDGSYYITMLPKDDNRHLAKVSLSKDSKKVDFLTEGDQFWVQDINCYDRENEVVYFRSTESSPRHRHVYSVDVKTKQRKCISCGVIKDTDGTNCTYHYPQFSKQCTWMSLMCQGPFVPITYMYNVKNHRLYQQLTSNTQTKSKLLEKDVPKSIYYTVKSDGFDIPVKETRPANFDPSKKYAVLFDVYGGPNTQKVTDKYTLEFSEYLACTHDIILVACDARGTGFNGYKFLHAVYRKLGYYESIDVINVAKHLQKNSYIDPKRIAIWGWSYGGFYAATALAMSGDVINTAVSVAPVTDWRYYDTVYSERYMGIPSPQDNLAGYEQTSVMSKAKQFRGKNFLLIHGTADDNVHFQNSAQLANALIREKVKFRSQFYPDREHGINSDGHIYYLISDFILAHLTKSHQGISNNEIFGFHFSNF